MMLDITLSGRKLHRRYGFPCSQTCRLPHGALTALHKLRVALVVRGRNFEMVQGFERENVLEPRNEVTVAP